VRGLASSTPRRTLRAAGVDARAHADAPLTSSVASACLPHGLVPGLRRVRAEHSCRIIATSAALVTAPPAASGPASEWFATTATSSATPAPASPLVMTATMPAIVTEVLPAPFG